jgi:Mg-chelatase subunit ChlD
MKTCSSNYINYETEICGLKKIRGELYKIKGSGSAFFQDCEVGKWNPEECTKSCNGGEQKLTRSILTQEQEGAKCLPLEAMRSCNNQPCPIDCKLESWTGWSKCSAPCGGGVKQRLREVKVAMKYGGHPCSTTSETVACNGFACEKDCELGDWTAWSECSKDCDGGTMKRQKFVKETAEGQGECPGEWSRNRLEYKECALYRCDTPATTEPLKCNSTLDVILLIDGSGSLGKAGWSAEIKAAVAFVDAFKDASEGKVELAVILFSGPRTWSGVSKCTGHDVATASLDYCGIKQVTHFTEDLNKVTQLLNGLDWPQGSTLTSLALLTAKAEMTLGRGDVHTVVVVFTDGRPLSYRKTGEVSHMIRKQARLLWVPITRFAPLSKIKEWATRRWQENVVIVKDFDDLEKPEVITHIIANMCPKKDASVQFTRR